MERGLRYSVSWGRLGIRKRLKRVERHTFARRVHHAEEVDTEGNTGDSRRVHGIIGDPEAEASEEQEERHQGECRQQQVPAPEGVNSINGRDGEKPVDYAEPKAR